MKIIERTIPESTVQTLVQSGINPLLARLYVARGVQSCEELDTGLGKLLPPSGLKGIQEAARVLADAIARQQRICIVADYDCDGATACAVGIRGLRMLGAQHVSYEVPDRITDGYGLSAPIARRVHAQGHGAAADRGQRHRQRGRRGSPTAHREAETAKAHRG